MLLSKSATNLSIICEMLHHLQLCNWCYNPGMSQSTNSTQHYVSVSNLPTLTSLLKHCFQNVFKTYITKHGV